ncbi:MAG: polysaccharide biosynthesis/export family protein [Planctomycetales bacterium]|nr:polysaccharide biosynthesis/export family protein [Planctomycetales bacterium]
MPTIRPGQLPASLAAQVPRSPNALDLSRLSTPSAPSDVVQPGDQLQLTVATGIPEADINEHPIRVDGEGNAHVPLVGPVQLAGLRVPEAERAVQVESIRRGIYREPQVALSMEKQMAHRVTINGAVSKPGVKSIPAASSDLFSALSESGGFQRDADTIVEITYPPQRGPTGQLLPSRTTRVDLLEIEEIGGSYPLPDGSAVMVPRRQPQTVHVDGLVMRPLRIELPFDRELRVLEAIAEAGGRRLSMADRIYVSRIDPGTGRTRVIQVSYKRALENSGENLVLSAGDVVTVQETPLTFTVGTLRNLIRFGFSSAVPGL